MNILSLIGFPKWTIVIALVVLTTRAAILINRFFNHRSHRKAIEYLKRSASLSLPGKR